MEYKMLTIITNTKCNLNCVYCNEWYRKKWDLIDRIFEWYDRINERIYNNLKKWIWDFNGVTFTSGEPTLNPWLPDLIKFSKELWYKKIELITNGIRLSNKIFLQKLINSWLNSLVVSVNTFDVELSKIIAWNNFDWFATLKWLINAIKLKLNTTVNIVITKHTLLTLKQTLFILKKIWIKNITLSYIRYEDFSELWFWNTKINYNKVSYTEIVNYIKKYNLQTFVQNFWNISFNDFPVCILFDIFNSWDFIKFWREYNFIDNNGNVVKKKKYFWKWNRDYLEKCNNCKYLNQCTWLEKDYIKIFWQYFVDKEIKPYL